jgi:phosphatidate cytidylyltransferase
LGVLKLNTLVFALISALFFALGLREWQKMCAVEDPVSIGALYVMYFLFTFMLYWVKSLSVLLAGTVIWLFPLYWVITFKGKTPFILRDIDIKAFFGVFILTLAWYGLNLLHQQPFGPWWILCLFILVWSVDSFAYFVGRLIGKKPLARHVSPKKTIQGFWGGLIGGLAVAALLVAIAETGILGEAPYLLTWGGLPYWLAIATGTILLAVLGDLLESLIKRISGVKDSGTIFPGHGGVLDRVDSLISTLPFFALCVIWFKGS